MYRFFREQFGCTFSVMPETMRPDKACQALERGDSIEDTAQMCGYNSSHTFRRAFKKRKGILPSDYRGSFDTEKK
nr:helix-turn-helix domain-containing protein [Acetatifactor aquisgranensis]